MREALIGQRNVLILREPKPVPEPSSKHRCVVEHDMDAAKSDNGAIIQCPCGKRYRCRERRTFCGYYVWVRRILPWPPKQAWPKKAD